MSVDTIYIPSTNGKNKLHTLVWRPEGEVQAILQISHGMIEYIDRYDDFASYLAKRHILVVGNDHLGHGKSVKSEDELGYFDAENGSQTVVNDLYEVTKRIQAQYPNVPYFVLGHSMGSFMIRRYLMTYGDQVDGAVIMGTGHQTKTALMAGNAVYHILKVIKGDQYRSKFMNDVALGSYNKKIEPKRTSSDWICSDDRVVDAYLADPYCTFLFSIQGFKTIFNTFSFINKEKNIKKIPQKLPVFFVAGEEDPVGNNGKSVKKIYEKYKKLGLKKARIKLYPKKRHEILNDFDKEIVYADIYEWLMENMVSMRLAENKTAI